MAVDVEPFSLVDPSGWEEFVRFMTANAFPFHMNPSPTREGLDSRREEGDFDGPDNEVLAARVQGELIGFVVVEDLESIAPLFDIRLANGARGKGLGTETVRELVRYLFREHPNIVRIEGQTREDNVAMRKAFLRSGFVKEAHYRKAWPTAEGPLRDAVAYGLLRSDFETGQTTPLVWDEL